MATLAASTLSSPWLVGLFLNTALLGVAWRLPKKLLTPAGYLHAWGLGILVWGALGWQGYAVVMIYFLAGSAVTRVGMARKLAAGIAEGRSGVRGPENVWGSALVGALCALALVGLSLGWPTVDLALWSSLIALAYVSSFSTKLADTTASEVGKAYGKHTFLITTLQAVAPGTEGAISLEGTLAGLVGAFIMAVSGWGVGLIPPWGIGVCLIAAFVATNLESVIGATLQTKTPWLTNEIVNIINTAIGAALALALGYGWWQWLT